MSPGPCPSYWTLVTLIAIWLNERFNAEEHFSCLLPPTRTWCCGETTRSRLAGLHPVPAYRGPACHRPFTSSSGCSLLRIQRMIAAAIYRQHCITGSGFHGPSSGADQRSWCIAKPPDVDSATVPPLCLSGVRTVSNATINFGKDGFNPVVIVSSPSPS
jgi:hypothetical protein